jgi:hypothetical protein
MIEALKIYFAGETVDCVIPNPVLCTGITRKLEVTDVSFCFPASRVVVY